MPFHGFIQEKYAGLIPDKHSVQSFYWHRANMEAKGNPNRYALQQEFRGGGKLLHLVTILLNKDGGQIAYWFIDVVSKQTYFRKWEQVEESIKDGKLKLV